MYCILSLWPNESYIVLYAFLIIIIIKKIPLKSLKKGQDSFISYDMLSLLEGCIKWFCEPCIYYDSHLFSITLICMCVSCIIVIIVDFISDIGLCFILPRNLCSWGKVIWICFVKIANVIKDSIDLSSEFLIVNILEGLLFL